MKAFAIFDGGGVKGAALAGCLAAARDSGIEFMGYGGTSAGAIVATLAAAGFSGEDIRELIKGKLHPKRILDDEGVLFGEAERTLKSILSDTTSDAWVLSKMYRVWKHFHSPFFKTIIKEHGLYDGHVLINALLEILKNKFPSLASHSDITFQDLKRFNCLPLKLVATDLNRYCAAVFSADHETYGNSVTQAVRASSSYPFLFQPVILPDGRRLVDGGIATNLPTFLFAEEQEATQYPILAFDLITTVNPSCTNIMELAKELMESALGASDELIVELLPGVKRIPIEVPATVTTLKFELNADDIDSLFNTGYQATGSALSKFSPLINSKDAGEVIQRQLWALYGDRKLFEPVLWALKKYVEENTHAKDVRTQIMLPTGRSSNSRIVTYFFGFRSGDADSDLELGCFDGCTGNAVKERRLSVADLQKAKSTFGKWGLTSQQQAKVAVDRQSMASVPIFAYGKDGSVPVDSLPVIGVLSIDSSTELMDTGWVGPDLAATKELYTIMTTWSDIVSKILR